MRTFIGLVACMSLGSSVAAWAQESAAPAQPDSTTAPTSAAPSQSAPPVDSTAPAANPTDASAPAKPDANAPGAPAAKPRSPNAATALTDDDRSFIRRGYQIEVKNGEKYYCKQQDTMGSRLNKKRVCMRQDQMDQLRTEVQDEMREKVRNNKPGT